MIELTLKEYATKHKISLFNVMKLAKAGQIPSETRIINQKTEIFILSDEAPKPEPVVAESDMDYKKAYFELKKRYEALLRKVNGES